MFLVYHVQVSIMNLHILSVQLNRPVQLNKPVYGKRVSLTYIKTSFTQFASFTFTIIIFVSLYIFFVFFNIFSSILDKQRSPRFSSHKIIHLFAILQPPTSLSSGLRFFFFNQRLELNRWYAYEFNQGFDFESAMYGFSRFFGLIGLASVAIGMHFFVANYTVE